MKSRLLTFFSFSFALGVFAQTPITHADFVTTLTTTFQLRGTNLVGQGEGGEDVIWDFSELGNQGSVDMEIVDTTGLPGMAIFNNPNLAWKRGPDYIHEYLEISDEKVQSVGTYAYDDSYYDYSNPITMVEFPIEIMDTYDDEFQFDYDLITAVGQITGIVDYVVDGYGTLIMPWGTVSNAFRVRFTSEQTEVFEAGQGPQTATYTSVNYSWFAAGYPTDLVRIADGILVVSGQEIPNQITQYLADFQLSIGEAEALELKNFEVYPNPANEMVTVRFDYFESDKLSLKIYDIQGRVLVQESISPANGGEVVKPVNVSDLQAGYYLLVIESPKGVKTQKISKLR